MIIKKNFKKNSYDIELTKGQSEVITILGKVGAGLVPYSKEILAMNLNKGYKVSYITDTTAKYLLVNSEIDADKLSNLKVFTYGNETLDFSKLITDETTDLLIINCFNTLTDSEKDYLFKLPHAFETVVLHQAPLRFKVDIDALDSINADLIGYSDAVAYIERNEELDFTLLKH